MTTVTRIPSLETTEYSCDARQAVVCAYEQQVNHNFNTWMYDFTQARRSGQTWYCGQGSDTFAAPAQD